ncbi:hypothetical protein QJS04_geneDACA005725 [Acorus gramineus]|uniref:Uncharacterized protein n=1 Tax=Acorus gramineus TaxID=55184 RepID=A0AAV9BFP8_ACOGR|nr:hypothetical protein QJS04_geneDACA005725 [Acorus gramineus]
MNIVKGVTDLIRRTSGGQTGESGSSSSGGKFSAPFPRIRFGEIGDEAVLHTLWQRYENAIDKRGHAADDRGDGWCSMMAQRDGRWSAEMVEKKKLLLLFFMHFIRTYKNWEPVCSVQSDQTPSSSFFSLEHGSSEDVVVGCSSGHPAEIIYILIQEIARITALVTDRK